MSNQDWSLEKITAVITVFILLLVPTVAIVETNRFHTILELSYMWPWLILIRLQPSSYFHTDMYNYVLPPWTFIVYLPFLFVLKYVVDQFKEQIPRSKSAGYIAILSLLQWIIIWIVFQSQDPKDLTITETRTLYFFPGWIIIILQTLLFGKRYIEEMQEVLRKPNKIQIEEEKE